MDCLKSEKEDRGPLFRFMFIKTTGYCLIMNLNVWR
jgi:hypothetical protein